ncbi:ABC transporter permease [Cupriavidus metallidurans]|uniref:ABC transporter permease n=1 Tax=Cupriavidus metallidurans TaxID=119219 RepID=UPI001644054D|nr:ABC transporter permease [Cupriavidus metallidurans]
MITRADRLARWLVCGIPIAFLLAFFGIPSAIMIVAAFRTPAESGGLLPLIPPDQGLTTTAALTVLRHWQDLFTLDNIRELIQEPLYAGLFLKSAGYAALTTAICLVAAYPLAWWIARSDKRRRDLLLILVILPFWSNFLIRIYAWMIILSPRGYLMHGVNSLIGWMGFAPVEALYTPAAVILVLVYVHLPFFILPLYASLEKQDPLLLDAARDLGANGWHCFWQVIWPLSLPGVYAGIALVFTPCLGIFAVPELVGGTRSILIGNLIKQQFLDSRDWPLGSALSLALVGIVLALIGLATLAARVKGTARVASQRGTRKSAHRSAQPAPAAVATGRRSS